MTYKIIRRLFSIVTIVLLTLNIGCGFKLRGNVTIPVEIKTVTIVPNNPNEDLQRNLRRVLVKKGVTIVAPDTKNVAQLHISEPTFSEQVLAVSNSNNLPERLKLQVSFNYSILDKNKKIVKSSTTIISNKDFSIDPNNLLSADNEREVIKRELYQEAINKLIRQINKAFNTVNKSAVNK